MKRWTLKARIHLRVAERKRSCFSRSCVVFRRANVWFVSSNGQVIIVIRWPFQTVETFFRSVVCPRMELAAVSSAPVVPPTVLVYLRIGNNSFVPGRRIYLFSTCFPTAAGIRETESGCTSENYREGYPWTSGRSSTVDSAWSLSEIWIIFLHTLDASHVRTPQDLKTRNYLAHRRRHFFFFFF